MTEITYSVKNIQDAFGNYAESDPWKLDNDEEVKNVVNVIASDGKIDKSDIVKLRDAGVNDAEIKALLSYYYGLNDEKTIDALLGDTTSFYLTNDKLDKGLDHNVAFEDFERLRYEAFEALGNVFA